MESQDVTGGGRPSRITPRSKRGIRTRQALIAAAREVFERDGYLDARITDISKAAGVAAGSFYTYFNDKEEIFAALVEVVQEEMLHPHLRERTGVTDPRGLIDAANREYLQSYGRNARLMALFEQVAQIDEKFHELRVERGSAFAERNAQMIRSLQARGEADPELDPLVTALSLSAMVGRMAYLYYVAEMDFSYDQLVTTLNRIWFNALGLRPSA
ncbi:TetR/AcrR family transcriptional regulator [Actinomadura napierensis]|uniref:TetR/AcrR family transcriptional regulator n=1 Tax=Actinomadura napierensis TaxID=267854 RepID=A0ABN2YX68_9ACTN